MRQEYSATGLARILEVDESVVHNAIRRLQILPVRVTDKDDDRGAGIPVYGRTEAVRIIKYVLEAAGV